jgi:hypothetical protein
VTVALDPVTTTEPVAVVLQPATIPTWNGYDPFGSRKTIVDVTEVTRRGPIVTFHRVPLGSPFSVNVTEYVGAKVTELFRAVPLTDTEPEAGVIEYPGTDPTV